MSDTSKQRTRAEAEFAAVTKQPVNAKGAPVQTDEKTKVEGFDTPVTWAGARSSLSRRGLGHKATMNHCRTAAAPLASVIFVCLLR